MSARDDLLAEAVARIEHLVAQRRQAVCASPLYREISMPQLHVLIMLEEHEATTVSELGHALGISAPSTSAILDRLEEHGFILRERDIADRRVVRIRISQRGSELVEEMIGTKRNRVRLVLEAMTDQELADLNRGAAALQAALQRIQPEAREAV